MGALEWGGSAGGTLHGVSVSSWQNACAGFLLNAVLLKLGKSQIYGSRDKWFDRGNCLFGPYFLACSCCDSSVLLLSFLISESVFSFFYSFPEGFGQSFPKLLWWAFPLLSQKQLSFLNE